MSEPPRFDRGHTDDLMSFLAASPSPYHAVANAAERLDKAGFRQVAETDAWDATSGGKYVLRGGAIVAWYVPEGAEASTPFRIVGGPELRRSTYELARRMLAASRSDVGDEPAMGS